MNARILDFFLCLLLAAIALPAIGRAQPPAKNDKVEATLDEGQIRKLIDQLGADDFRQREAATKKLSELADVPPALREAMKSGNPEVRRRAALVVSRISTRLAEKQYQEAVAELQKFELDDLIYRMVTDEKSRTEKNWKLIQTVVKAVSRRARYLDGKTDELRFPIPNFDLKSMPIADVNRWNRNGDLRDEILLLNNPTRTRTSITNCLVLCSGPLPGVTTISNSIIIADGDIEGANAITNSLLIARGHFGGASPRGSIILATGLSGNYGSCDDSFLQVANKSLLFMKLERSVLVKTEFKTTVPSTSRTIDVDGPLQILKFSLRKGFDQSNWSEAIDGLAIAIEADTRKDRILVCLKNVGATRLGVPNMPIKLLLKGPDGKFARSNYEVSAPPRIGPLVVLDPGQTYESTLYLWSFLEKPAATGKYQLTIMNDKRLNQIQSDRSTNFWRETFESKPLEIDVTK
jgi:hypothetical protein